MIYLNWATKLIKLVLKIDSGMFDREKQSKGKKETEIEVCCSAKIIVVLNKLTSNRILY